MLALAQILPAAMAAAAIVLFAPLARASLTFDLTYAQQCTPLNISWTPKSTGYPYSVYIMGIGSAVQSWRINSDYPLNGGQITFQYLVPVPSPTFSSFMVSVVDSVGNGNVSSVIPINVGNSAPSSCAAYAGTTGFFYAADSTTGQAGDRTQCGSVKYYAVNPPYRGTAPFSLSLVPINGVPITVNIPQSDTRNETYFVSTSVLALQAGVQFYQFMSDGTGGGTGGGSPVYTVSEGSNSNCLASSYKLANQDNSHALPVGAQTASFQNLPGAISLADRPASNGTNGSSGGGSNHGGLIGGIIGAVIGVGAILLVIAGYIVYRRRLKRKRELERKEQPQFIDLDEDEFGSAGAPVVVPRRTNNGVQQSYSVSPFTYEPTAMHSSNAGAASEVMPYRDEEPMLGAAGYPSNLHRPLSANTSDFDPSTHNSTHGQSNEALAMYDHSSRSRSPGVAGGATQYPPTSATSSNGFAAPMPWQNQMGRSPFAASATGSSEGASSGGYMRPMAPAHSPSGEFGASSTSQNSPYVLRTRNTDERIDRGNVVGEQGGSGSGGRAAYGETPRSPNRMPTGLEHDEPGQRPTSRFVQHEDAGPLAAARPAAEEEVVEEVPPSYASWAHHTNTASSAANTKV